MLDSDWRMVLPLTDSQSPYHMHYNVTGICCDPARNNCRHLLWEAGWSQDKRHTCIYKKVQSNKRGHVREYLPWQARKSLDDEGRKWFVMSMYMKGIKYNKYNIKFRASNPKKRLVQWQVWKKGMYPSFRVDAMEQAWNANVLKDIFSAYTFSASRMVCECFLLLSGLLKNSNW